MSYFGDGSAIQADVNIVPMRNVYGGADGGTLATLGSAGSPDTYNPNGNAMATASVATPVQRGGIAWWVGIAIIIVLMVLAARKTGNADEFKNLRASTYNILFITLVAIVGLTATKILAVKLRRFAPLQGLSDVILAA